MNNNSSTNTGLLVVIVVLLILLGFWYISSRQVPQEDPGIEITVPNGDNNTEGEQI